MEKKKVGILTYHSVCNFGANLQTLSTVNFLKRSGMQPVVINWMPDDLDLYYKKITPDNQYLVHKKFVHDFLPVSTLCRNKFDIADFIKKEDIHDILIGSDAVFSFVPKLLTFNRRRLRFEKLPSNLIYPNPFWGDFVDLVPDVHIYGMSVSAQNTNFKYLLPSTKRSIRKRLEKFSYISVRDSWTKDMLCILSKGTNLPQITPDPVFAFNQNAENDYLTKDYILEKYRLPENYLLFSLDSPLLTKEWYTQFENKCSSYGFSCFALARTFKDMPSFINNRINIPIPPLDWYYLIKYSKGYVGELMHPILVALHNAVPCYSFDKYGFLSGGQVIYNSSKIYHILSTYNLLSNYKNIVNVDSLPSPLEILNAIINFDTNSCRDISNRKYEEYYKMMNKIISLF